MNDILIKFILSAGTLFIMFNIAGLLTWVERKQSAVMQDRIGANRASIFGFKAMGLFHALADVLKMLSKEEFIPDGANKFLFNIAPYLSVIFALVGFAAIPIGGTLILNNHPIELQAANLNIALIFIFAMMSMGVYGVVLAGFSSNNNYAFLGGMRGAAQILAYEITMGAAIMGVIMVFNTIDLQALDRAQGAYMLGGWIPKWGVFVQPLAFFLFLTAATAETKRTPFDLPEGESEIIGYFVEYSGMKFGMFFLADLVETVLVSALMTTLFFGGWQVPYLHTDGFHLPWGAHIFLGNLPVVILGILAFFTKVAFFIWLLMAIRWTLPRFRYDQLMNLGWKILLPVSLINIAITAVVITLFKVSMDNTTEKRRQELEKYYDPKGPFAVLRVSQMKRAWKQSNRRELNFWENTYFPMLFSGIYLTSKHFFYNVTFHILHLFGIAKNIKGAVTYQYPEVPRPLSSRLRTRHRLTKREDGSPRCVACMMCETVCPARCIEITAAEHPDPPNIEKYPAEFILDLGKCVYCGFCVEVCPEDAIRMDTQKLNIAEYSRESMIYNKKRLMDE